MKWEQRIMCYFSFIIKKIPRKLIMASPTFPVTASPLLWGPKVSHQ